MYNFVTPAKPGVQGNFRGLASLDSRLRGNDGLFGPTRKG